MGATRFLWFPEQVARMARSYRNASAIAALAGSRTR